MSTLRHPGCKYLICVMLIYSFKGVFTNAPLSRAVASVGSAPGTKRNEMQNNDLKKKSHSCCCARNRHQFVVQYVAPVI